MGDRDEQMDRQTDRQTDRQADRQTVLAAQQQCVCQDADQSERTKERVGDVLGHLVSRFAGLCKVTQLLVQHSLELQPAQTTIHHGVIPTTACDICLSALSE